MPKPHRAIGLDIRRALLYEGKISPYDFWKQYRPDVSYSYIKSVFWILKQLGLIRPAEKTWNKTNSPYGKVYYEIVPGKENDECWASPQGCYKRFMR